ncbi:hypothetical protein MUO14_15645 [Halobacillus shinanisalinarum]|uniref:Type II toxin-antitoxin system PemK/MazF family toxin n=1 Tax=Halobacillus shinanisalinarum TaxID=2932258 RepID=A0ABY4GVD7_9BACI|nr:hypothetical protein [Halobacillus shinanisalinarum]UOQ91936.1 hypothetical protein MUO14_15645 [Halobacillus shinanisalinarum]
MNSKVKQGDVWLADVLFKGTRQTKQRPVIMVGNELALDGDVHLFQHIYMNGKNIDTENPAFLKFFISLTGKS